MGKKISILGSTGSIGKSTLQVVSHLGEEFSVDGLAAHSNIDLLEKQAKQFLPKLIAVYDHEKAEELKHRLPHFKIVSGMEGLVEVATLPSIDLVMMAIAGSIGIHPTIKAIEAEKDIALATKEVLITAGSLIVNLAKKQNIRILPVDSEHNALFQCLQNEDPTRIRRLILTASGGPFREFSKEELEKVSVEDALDHPSWNMGKKVTVDSSTLMNKGLEVIEAHHFFGVSVEKIDVVVHPQSIVHSFVEFIDGSLIAQVAQPQMVIPIQYALTFPERQKGIVPCFDFTKYSKLEFYEPDFERFPCLRLAYEAAELGGDATCFMNAANEILVMRFLQNKIKWGEIGTKLEGMMKDYQSCQNLNLDALLALDAKARQQALEV